jgi:diguanylate cyclase (GGDEF)-like protein
MNEKITKIQAIASWIKTKHDPILEWFVPKDEPATSERTTYYINLFYVWILSLFCVPFYLARFISLGMTSVAIVLSFGGLLMMGSPLIYKKTNSLGIARELYILGLYALNFSQLIYFEGLVSSALWFGVLPVIAVLLGGITSAIIWLAIDAITILSIHLIFGNNLDFIDKLYPFWYEIYLESHLGLIFALTIFIVLGEISRRSAFGRLKKAHEQIHELAIRDALTGIYNRRYIWDEMSGAERHAQQGEATFSVCLIDLDKFKSINDTYGHPMGDEVLKSVAAHMQSQIRTGDICARYGGEEFLCLLNNTNVENAFIFADRLRQTVSELVINDLKVSISVGVAQYAVDEDFSKTLARADAALYIAKENGRNRVVKG